MPPLSLLMLLHPSQSQSQSSLSSDESPASVRRFRSCSSGSSAEFICTNTTTTSTTMMMTMMPKAPTLSPCSCSSPPPPPLPLPSSSSTSSTIVMNDNTNHDNNDNTNSEHEEEENEEIEEKEEAIEDQQQEEQQEQEEQQQQERKGKGKQHISFNPQVLVIQPLYMENKKQQVQQQQQPCDKSQCWYSEKDIDNFQKHAFFTIRRFQRNWRLKEEDCLRGLESQTTKYTATKVRINVYKDLILAKKEISKRMLANSPVKTKHMISLILGASTQDALELAKRDAEAAQRYQQEISIPPPPQQNQEKDQAFKCFFFDLSKWLGNANKSPAIVDLPMI